MSQEIYKDVQEITDLDAIWKANKRSKFIRYVVVLILQFIIYLILFILVAYVLTLIGGLIFLLTDTIYAYSSGRDPEHLGLLLISGIFTIPILLSIVVFSFWLIFGVHGDLRYLIRFKIFTVGVDFSEGYVSVIEALTRTLESNKGWSNLRRYKRKKLGDTQLELLQKYLMKKYQRDVTVNECLQFFSIGEMTIKSRSSSVTEYKNYFFVMLDEKKGEILFYSNDYDEWLYLREELEEKGFQVSDIRETTVDMKDYVINDDGTIERKKKRRRKGDTVSLEDSEIKNV